MNLSTLPSCACTRDATTSKSSSSNSITCSPGSRSDREVKPRRSVAITTARSGSVWPRWMWPTQRVRRRDGPIRYRQPPAVRRGHVRRSPRAPATSPPATRCATVDPPLGPVSSMPPPGRAGFAHPARRPGIRLRQPRAYPQGKELVLRRIQAPPQHRHPVQIGPRSAALFELLPFSFRPSAMRTSLGDRGPHPPTPRPKAAELEGLLQRSTASTVARGTAGHPPRQCSGTADSSEALGLPGPRTGSSPAASLRPSVRVQAHQSRADLLRRAFRPSLKSIAFQMCFAAHRLKHSSSPAPDFTSAPSRRARARPSPPASGRSARSAPPPARRSADRPRS